MCGSKGQVTGREDASLENTIDAANRMEVEQRPLGNLLTKDSRGGEVVGKEDVWSCLFKQKRGQADYSEEAEREAVRHVGMSAAEARLDLGGDSGNGV